MHIIIAGSGKLPYFLAKRFLAKSYRVTVITKLDLEAEELARKSKATIIVGDASEPGVLRSADAYYCDLLVAVTPRDEDNLAISQIAKMEFGISKTLALVNDPENTEVFHKLGCKAFSTTEMISLLVEQSVQIDEIISFVPTEEGKILLTEFQITPLCPVLNIPLKDISRPDQSLLVSIVREGKVIVPNGASVLQDGDRVLVLSTPENHSQVVRLLTDTAK